MIQFYNRKTGMYEVERVAGESYLNWTYSSTIGRGLLELLVKRKIASRIYGYYCDRAVSKRKIPKFIQELQIDMSNFEVPAKGFGNFNEFFFRKFQEDRLQFELEENAFISPCEGKVLAYENIDVHKLYQVKGLTYTLPDLIGDEEISANYAGGVCLVFRLNPANYHRFHFVDQGICSPATKIPGVYYSVNPIALERMARVFCANKREWSMLDSRHFDQIIYVEVGATFVGSIVQTYREKTQVQRGDEKGYFKFGGSTVILFLKANSVKIDGDILEQSAKGLECSVNLGERIGGRFAAECRAK